MQDLPFETFDSPILADAQLNQDGSLKSSGKQQVRFYHKKELRYRAIPLKDPNGEPIMEFVNGRNRVVFDMDPKTGLPKKEAYTDIVEMVRVETKGDTNIKDDRANDLDRRLHWRQYKYFKEGKIPTGTPIEELEYLQPTTITELRLLGIGVIEQIAEMSDLECEQVHSQPGYELRDVADQWVKANSASGLRATKIEVDLKMAQDKIRELEAKLDKGDRRAALKSFQAESVDSPDSSASVQTMEVSPEEMKKGRKRLVS